MTETNVQVGGALTTTSSIISDVIGSHVIVDIGTIQSVDENGFATVSTGRTVRGRLITYSNVELMYIGNRLGSIQVAPAGSTCLLFCPKTVMPSTEIGSVTYTAPPYSISGMKAIPLTHGRSSKAHIGITPSGSITMAGGTFSVEVSSEGLAVRAADGTTQVRVTGDGGVSMSYGSGLIQKFIGSDGSINEVRFASDGKVMYFEKYELSGATTIKRVSKGPVKLSEINTYDEWAMVNKYLPDGTVTDDTSNSSGLSVTDSNGNTVSSLTLAASGDSVLMGTNTARLDCKDSNDQSQASVLCDTQGNVTITAMKTLTIDIAQGKFNLSVDDMGKLSVTATQECTITDGANTVAMSAAGVEITDGAGNSIKTSAAGIECSSALGTKLSLGATVSLG